MPVYEWTGGKPLRSLGQEIVENGETFRAPRAVGEAFPDLVEEHDDTNQDVDTEVRFSRNGGVETVDTPDESDEDTGPTDEADEETADEEVPQDVRDLLEGTVGDVEAALASGEFDDRLDALERGERQGENRKGVRAAIRARRD